MDQIAFIICKGTKKKNNLYIFKEKRWFHKPCGIKLFGGEGTSSYLCHQIYYWSDYETER